MHVIQSREHHPEGQIDVKIGVCIDVKYRYEPDLSEPHVYKFMGCVVTGVTKRHAIDKLQTALARVG